MPSWKSSPKVPLRAENDEAEKAPFIDGDGLEAGLTDDKPLPECPSSSSPPRNVVADENFPARRLWIAHAVAFVLYTSCFCIVLASTWRHCSCDSLLWSPAQEAVEWNTQVIDAIPGSTIYTAYPNPESDAAWSELLRGISIKILPDEMEKLGYESLELRDGSGFVGSLGVYHELHCLKRVRKMIYKDYYYANISEEEYGHRLGHIEHCLEQLRQSSICHSDVNVIPFSWIRDRETGKASPSMQFGSLHRCVNWERLDKWAKERRVDLFDENLLVDPPEEGHEVLP